MTPTLWIWPLLFFLAIITAILRSPWFKGWQGEMIIRVACRLLDKRAYRAIHNVTLSTPDGGTAQIDHIIVSRFGIFVVETKNYRGAIYGSGQDRTWKQVIGRQKNSFRNPLRQNYCHVVALAEVVGIPREKCKSVVMFTGSARLKTRNKLPENVLTHGLLAYIKSHRELLLSADEIKCVVRIIAEKRLAPNFTTRRRHVQNVRSRVDNRRAKR